MRFTALATDYDGTIADDGIVSKSTLEALRRVRKSSRKLIMVTGRELPDLLSVCPDIKLFDLVVAENGAILFDPDSEEERVLAPAPSQELVLRLREKGVPDVSVGRSIIALWKPHEIEALKAIQELGLEAQIVFNKQAVMILPSSVNKATGLAAALERLGLDAANVVAIGDAENDHSFIEACGFGVAVQNAIPSLKDRVHHVTKSARGAGASELIADLLADDLKALTARAAKRQAPSA
jgi:HAD superfamily hydrolase (TIGR01484 family)